MKFAASQLAFDYRKNATVEQTFADLLTSIDGRPSSDFCHDRARTELDWYHGRVPIELKTTDRELIPVEVSKDEAGLVPSGVAATIAPYILTISTGLGFKSEGSPPRGKVRLIKTSWLLAKAKSAPPDWRPGDTPSQSALIFHVGPFFPGAPKELWLGDVQFFKDERTGLFLYDMDTFVQSRHAKMYLDWLADEYEAGELA